MPPKKTEKKYTIYLINHEIDNGISKKYVGTTIRPLQQRLRAHISEKSRNRNVTVGSLGEAIRIEFSKDPNCKRFTITKLESVYTDDAAKAAEKKWIKELQTAAPNGYNLMPGGASLGGTAHSKHIKITIDGEERHYTSLADLCRELFKRSYQKEYFRVASRLNSGWTIRQALELDPRTDKRSTEFSRQTKLNNLSPAAEGSRKQREKAKKNHPPLYKYELPDREDLSGKKINAREFSKKENIPASTVRYRAQRIGAKGFLSLTSEAALKILRTRIDHSHIISVKLPTGELLNASHREIARLTCKGAHPLGTLSPHRIRTNLKNLPSLPTEEQKLVAIGMLPKFRKNISIAPPVPRKTLCNEYIITNTKGLTIRYLNQTAFAKACYEAIVKNQNNQTSPLNIINTPSDKAIPKIQKFISRKIKSGLSPTEIAIELKILDELIPR